MTDRIRPWGVHSIHSMVAPGNQSKLSSGLWGWSVAMPYTGNRIVAAWWVLTGRAYAIVWPTHDEFNAALGAPEPKLKD